MQNSPLGMLRYLAPVLAIGGVIAVGCDGSTSEELTAAKLSQGCLINSDCTSPLVCAFRRCHSECTTSRDCAEGQRCVAADRPFSVCQLDDERECLRNSDCPSNMVCGVDAQCRDQCATERDCISGQVCAAGTCADLEELDPSGSLPPAPTTADAGTATPCVYTSDCASPLVCKSGACVPECREDRDCAFGFVCMGGSCVGGADGSAGCLYAADCLPGEICDNGFCHCECRDNRDCASGSHCDGCGCVSDLGDGGSGSLGSTCGSDADCSGTLICRNARCNYECVSNGDCASGICDLGSCRAASCADGVKNGDESDVDCGGTCSPCPLRKACSAGSDCATGVCAGSVCAAASCFDVIKNGDETDVDCGGSCGACADGAQCVEAVDCTSQSCVAGKCAAPNCNDLIKNGSESDVDCGGSCPPCGGNAECLTGADCSSKICVGGSCVPGTCNDGVQNQNETGPDCGGACGPCPLGSGCGTSADCNAGICDTNTCRPAVSCLELHTVQPQLGDGSYALDTDGSGPVTTFMQRCDMTNDGGGWTLVTATFVEDTVTNQATGTTTFDTNGGIIVNGSADTIGCNGAGNAVTRVRFKDLVAWTQVRYDSEFSGSASCWSIFGDETTFSLSTKPMNLIPLVIPPDTITNQVAMGGSVGDLFDGFTTRCDNNPTNFWHPTIGNGLRSASVIQRRDTAAQGLAGIGVGANCTGSSGASWKLSNVYIR